MQSGFSLVKDKLKFKNRRNKNQETSRNVGKIKTCTIRKEAGNWYACFSCEKECSSLPKNGKSIGIDLGIESFATFDNGEKVENPNFSEISEKPIG